MIYIFCRLSAVNWKENILSLFLRVHAYFVSGGCCLYVACGDTMLFVYVAFMGGLVQFCWVFLVDILSSSHSLGYFDM